jgi:hypothetical protein
MLGPVPLVAIFALGLVQKVQANWPMPFYFSTLLLLSEGIGKGAGLKSLRPALSMGFFMVGLAYALPFTSQVLGLRASIDPTTRLRQWQSLALDIHAVRQRVFTDLGNSFVLVDGHRHLVSELAFYLPGHPHVFRLSDATKVESQYEIWPGPVGYIGKDALVISHKNPQQLAGKIGKAFADVKFIDTVIGLKGTDSAHTYHIYLATKWPI